MSKSSAVHTLEDLLALAQADLPDQEAADLLSKRKGGLQPVQLAAILAAVNSGRLLDLFGEEKPTGETQADRMERLLEAMVGALEAKAVRICAIECALTKPSTVAMMPKSIG